MKPTLVMLHGGGGSGPGMKPLTDLLEEKFTVFSPNLVGHGGRPIPERIRFKDWVDDLLKQLDERAIKRAAFFGYSMGGLLALYMARRHPRRVSAVCALAAKIVFDRPTVDQFDWLCDVEKVVAQGGTLAAEMEKLHQPQDWKALYRTMRPFYPALMEDPPLTDEDLKAIKQPVLIMSSGRDLIVPLQETITLGLALPGSHTVVFPRFAHPLKRVPVKFVANVATQWLEGLG